MAFLHLNTYTTLSRPHPSSHTLPTPAQDAMEALSRQEGSQVASLHPKTTEFTSTLSHSHTLSLTLPATPAQDVMGALSRQEGLQLASLHPDTTLPGITLSHPPILAPHFPPHILRRM